MKRIKRKIPWLVTGSKDKSKYTNAAVEIAHACGCTISYVDSTKSPNKENKYNINVHAEGSNEELNVLDMALSVWLFATSDNIIKLVSWENIKKTSQNELVSKVDMLG